MASTNPLRLLPVALLVVLAAQVPAAALDARFSCTGLAPLFLGCAEDEVVWTRNTTIEYADFVGRVVLVATWLFKPGEIHYSGVVCEGPLRLEALPPEVRSVAPPPGCHTFAYPRTAPIAAGKLVAVTCEAQSREIGPEQWIGPAGPWGCAVV